MVNSIDSSTHASIYAHTFNSHSLNNLSQQDQQKIQELSSIDTKVRAHEMAHQAVGGQFAAAPSYTTTKGPDGKEYAVAGEVPIKIEKGNTPKETIANMQQIKAAALAPSDPSPQDLKVAQTADMIAAKAAQEQHKQDQNGQDQNGQDQNPTSQQTMGIDTYA
ncbi:MAG: hypothetical protein GXO40_03285 [Epsilonproteobacteria bacterium]|nr:hypothetical protein [Campylobacterota bacterium]